jgi:hypothetical protein
LVAAALLAVPGASCCHRNARASALTNVVPPGVRTVLGLPR